MLDDMIEMFDDMKKGRITKLQGGKAMRTLSMEGVFGALPQEGTCFAIMGAGITPGTFGRIITTSLIVKLEEGEIVDSDSEKVCIMHTETGSRYMLEILE